MIRLVWTCHLLTIALQYLTFLDFFRSEICLWSINIKNNFDNLINTLLIDSIWFKFGDFLMVIGMWCLNNIQNLFYQTLIISKNFRYCWCPINIKNFKSLLFNVFFYSRVMITILVKKEDLFWFDAWFIR